MVPRWILEREGISPNNRNLQGLVDFTLAWGYVESKVMAHRRQGDSLNCVIFSQVIPKGEQFIDDVMIDNAYAAYRARYNHGHGFENRMRGLHLAKRFRNEVIKTFRDPNPSSQLRARAVGFIVCRLRNNLFHGTKSLHDILAQQDLLAVSAVGLQGLLVGLEPRLNPAEG
ncbi:hypothetical protein [Nitratidesulfovibrio vulgaris]|uniref:hypothetical protein n=1 Tax=Nitratidesulfovibrio vulgaris TaxID=881 RepID=UPI0013E01FE8|nr:hypothetical protein [Nitratidesulfovibrio vulgaris]